jgi:hypothetical protein
MPTKGDKFVAKSIVPGITDQVVEFVGIQDIGVEGYPSFGLYNLTQGIAGHPAHSTVSKATLTDYGFVLSDDAP